MGGYIYKNEIIDCSAIVVNGKAMNVGNYLGFVRELNVTCLRGEGFRASCKQDSLLFTCFFIWVIVSAKGLGGGGWGAAAAASMPSSSRTENAALRANNFSDDL